MAGWEVVDWVVEERVVVVAVVNTLGQRKQTASCKALCQSVLLHTVAMGRTTQRLPQVMHPQWGDCN